MYRHSIIFHKGHILLSERSIFWDTSLLHFSHEIILRKINLDTVDLIELDSIQCLILRGQWVAPKEALHFIDMQQFDMLAKALSILQWDKQHQFCGACGQKTLLTHQSFERHCSVCEIKYYPRISPAVMVLIKRGNEILMARSPHFAPGVYALIAGFVEGGESLEAAVHREVFEEVGIKIKNLSYYGSQSWPFPDSLMIGFTAEYDSGEIVIDKNELEDAGWYSFNQLPGLPSYPMSIAFKMIHSHFEGCA